MREREESAVPVANSSGIDIAYEVVGDGPPVVLVQGFGLVGAGWMNQVPPLAEHFTVVTLDNRDSGGSGHASGPYTVADMAGDVVAVMDHAGIDRAIVGGLSLGGYVAQQVALDHPDRVAGLLLIGTTANVARFGGATPYTTWATIKRAAPDILPLEVGLWVMTPAFRTNAAALGQIGEAIAGMLATYPDDGYARTADAMNAFDVSDRLGEITAPTLVVVGAEDIITPIADAEELVTGIPDATLAVVPGGHGAIFEAPDAVNAALLDHLGVGGSA